MSINTIELFSILPGNTHIEGQLTAPLTVVTDDSRCVQAGACYIAVRGSRADGHDFIDQAVQAGAIAIVAERPCPSEFGEKNILWVQVSDTHEAAGLLLSAWYGFPSRDMIGVGVTGTNGKTTISYLIQSILRHTWVKAGLIGTILYDDGAHRCPSVNTTPGAAELQCMLSDMVRNGCRAFSMELSSHALVQRRTAGLFLRVGIFTNLTQDHLDYHGDMESYYAAKRKLFENMAALGDKKCCAVINADDPYGRRLIDEFSGKLKVITFSTEREADFRAIPGTVTLHGSDYELVHKGKSYLVRVPLIGRFNISNSLAALAGAVAAGVGVRDAISCLARAPQVPGRLELVSSTSSVPAFVDYAHTPDALVNVCGTLRCLCPGRLITVFGCGGDRDHTKRPLMGQAAASLSDVCIVTSDNPRSEDPDAIIDEIMPGIPESARIRVTDRGDAIRHAFDIARRGDLILIAGKGHETYQEIRGVRHSFSDVAIVRAWCMAREEEIQAKKQAEKSEKKRI